MCGQCCGFARSGGLLARRTDVRGNRQANPNSIHHSQHFEPPITLQAFLSSDDGQESTSEIELPANGVFNDALLWKPKSVGNFTLTLRIPTVEGEVSESNNVMTASISVRQESLRVLVVDTFPRWEYRFLRNALMRDPGVDVSCVLIHPKLSQRSEGKDYLTQIPDSVEELAKFDVIFLGDIGQAQGQLTIDDCDRIKTVVRNHAVGLVFLPGIHGNHLNLVDTNYQTSASHI